MLFIKGLIIGIGKIIPGVSGSVIAISFGLYEKGIDAINNYFGNVKENTKFLLVLGSGILLSIILMSNLIKILLNKYYFLTILLFIGLISGGIPSLFSKIKDSYNIKNLLLFLIIIAIIVFVNFLKSPNNINIYYDLNGILLLILIGIVDAATMIIPGISGTAILILMGCYDIMLNLFSNLTNFTEIIKNIKYLIPFVIGLSVGIIIFVKLMDYFLKNYKEETYWGIAGLAISSIISMFITTLYGVYQLKEVFIGILLFILGYIISKTLSTKSVP